MTPTTVMRTQSALTQRGVIPALATPDTVEMDTPVQVSTIHCQFKGVPEGHSLLPLPPVSHNLHIQELVVICPICLSVVMNYYVGSVDSKCPLSPMSLGVHLPVKVCCYYPTGTVAKDKTLILSICSSFHVN